MEQHVRLPRCELTVISFTPTGDPAAGPAEDGAACHGQADGIDVSRGRHGARQLQEAYVVVHGRRVVRRVAHCLGDCP